MAAGSRSDGGAQLVSARIRTTIQSIKEIVGNHSDVEIYAMLKETNMDPNETAQKLLNQDPFHEVKRKRDKRKENTGYRRYSDVRDQAEQNTQWAKPHAQQAPTDNGRVYTRNQSPGTGINREFRIVRDNRFVSPNVKNKEEAATQHSSSGNGKVKSDALDRSSSVVRTDRNHLSVTSSDRPLSEGLNDASSSGRERFKPLLPKQTHPLQTMSHRKGEVHGTQKHSRLPSTGVYSSSSDSKAAGTAGTIRRHVGAMGVWKQSSEHSSMQTSTLRSLIPDIKRESSTLAGPSSESASMPTGSLHSQRPASQPLLHPRSTGRSSFGTQNKKLSQASVANQKAMQPIMEWKPKSVSKPVTDNPEVTGTASEFLFAGNNNSSDAVEVASLSDKFSQTIVLEKQHVIIPAHLRVPESEHTRLTFGSFGAGFDSTRELTAAFQESSNLEHIPESIEAGFSEVSAAEQRDMDDQDRSLQFDSSPSAAEPEELPHGDIEPLNAPKVENYEDIGLIRNNVGFLGSDEAQELHHPASLPGFSAYDSETSNDVPFLSATADGAVPSQGIASLSEALSSHINSSTVLVSSQPQMPVQPQPVAQLYPQVHISHFPNLVPYRHVYSPVYVPPMAMPNYSTNIAYPHPSNGNNYLQMPGGSSHLSSSSVKYGAPQYKSVPAGNSSGFGNYTHPAGFTISSPGVIGGTSSLEDITRIKFKDNSFYVPNPQVEASDIWIQTPREIPTLQSPPYYNLSGQTTPTPFLPNHAGSASFNAPAQSSQLQYPGLYPPQQSASIVGPHHLAHQQVPSPLGGSVGVGMAAPGPQIGAYQQPQLGHLNWRANF